MSYTFMGYPVSIALRYLGSKKRAFVSVGTAAILHHDFASLALADDAFVAVTPPVSADHLAAEAVSPAFLEYLREIRPELIDSAG